MGLLEIEKAPSGMRNRRFLAFLIDGAIVLFLSLLVYKIWGEPDFFRVKAAMDAAEAAGGQDTALTTAVFSEFDRAYGRFLLIAFAYEALTQILTNGSSIGKLLTDLQIIPQNSERSRVVHLLLLLVRSGIKMLSMYLFQGFPFLICCLTIFTNAECRTGFDMAIKARTVRRSENR